MSQSITTAATPGLQYSVADLFRFVTVAAGIMAMTPLTGAAAAVLLVTMALAIATRLGMIAILLFLGALHMVEMHGQPDPAAGIFFTLLVGIAVLAWYRLERFWIDSRTPRQT